MSYDPLYEASKVLPLERISRKLEDLAASGEGLSRTRFSRSPPSVPSAPTTVYEDTAPPSPGEQLEDKEDQDLLNSTADGQWAIQADDELDRMRAARDRGLLQKPRVSEWEEAADGNVRYRWIQQGIWDKRWDTEHRKKWKHEWRNSSKPLQLSQATRSAEAKATVPASKRKADDVENDYQNAERSAIAMQEQQMSRPCYQFVHQFCEERQWIKMGLSIKGPDPSADLDATAYENVKSRWIKHGIWDDDWTMIPGVWWRHERPRKHPPIQEHFRKNEAAKAARIEEAERPPEWYPMAPERPLVITRNRIFSTQNAYKHEAGSPNPGPSASSSTSVPSECKAKRNTKPQKQRLPASLDKKSTSNGTNGSTNIKNIQKQKAQPRQARGAKAGTSKNERALAANKHQPQKKQRRATNVASSRPLRAAAVAATKKMAHVT